MYKLSIYGVSEKYKENLNSLPIHKNPKTFTGRDCLDGKSLAMQYQVKYIETSPGKKSTEKHTAAIL